MALDGRLGEVTDDQATTALRLFAPKADGDDAYRAAFPAATPQELYELVHSDWLFRMPSLHLAEAHVAAGGRAYFYELTWAAPGMGGVLGACHGLDVPLVFGNLVAGLPAMLLGETPPPETAELSARFRAAWTGFAAGEGPGWPVYDLERRLVQLFDVRPTVSTYPEDVSRALWEGYVFGPLPLSG
jgi:para-nitrobenzyl esterase